MQYLVYVSNSAPYTKHVVRDFNDQPRIFSNLDDAMQYANNALNDNRDIVTIYDVETLNLKQTVRRNVGGD